MTSPSLPVARVCAAAAVAVAGVVACASPQERYRLLAHFFDGVPDPDAPPPAPLVPDAQKARAAARAPVAPTSIHPPYAAALTDPVLCDRCHRNNAARRGSGDFGSIDLTGTGFPWATCRDCHGAGDPSVPARAMVARPGAWLHAPVAAGDCRRCHEGHRSPWRRLLRSERAQPICVGCHDALATRTGAMSGIDCPTCHDPHSAERASDLFLRSGPAGTCATCHDRVAGGRWTHGPVAAGACTACHDPHGLPGTEHHVRRPIAGACAACHAGDDRCSGAAQRPPRECDSCHDPHASAQASDMFLGDRSGGAKTFATREGPWTKGAGDWR